ncbi:MAG: hypothetical protein Q9172_003751 [Xanthocarpia lactea]
MPGRFYLDTTCHTLPVVQKQTHGLNSTTDSEYQANKQPRTAYYGDRWFATNLDRRDIFREVTGSIIGGMTRKIKEAGSSSAKQQETEARTEQEDYARFNWAFYSSNVPSSAI